MRDHPAALPIKQLLDACRITTTRRSGPGGQHRNKVETAIVIEYLPSSITAEASESRSQATNKDRAVQRLRLALARQVRSPIDGENPPSELWQSRCRGKSLSVSTDHVDLPALLAEALDAIEFFEHRLAEAAQWLQISTSQLVKLLKKDATTFERLNDRRRSTGIRPLR
jgi:hypothetical protein